MVFDEQKQLPDSTSTEALWNATPAITSAERKGGMTAYISGGQLGYQLNRNLLLVVFPETQHLV
jgi:hypothetical protein